MDFMRTHVYLVEFSEHGRRGIRVFATVPTPAGLREAYLSVGVEWARQELQAHHIRLGTPPTEEAMAACVNDVEVGPDFEFHVTERSAEDVRAFMTVFGRYCSEIQILVSHMPLMGVSSRIPVTQEVASPFQLGDRVRVKPSAIEGIVGLIGNVPPFINHLKLLGYHHWWSFEDVEKVPSPKEAI